MPAMIPFIRIGHLSNFTLNEVKQEKAKEKKKERKKKKKIT